MELFEILFILFFILIPIINGISKSRKRRESDDIQLPGEAQTGRPRSVGDAGPRTVDAPERDRHEPPWSEPREEPVEAADMVPDDLWEILTGERRQHGPAPRPAEPEPEPEPEPIGASEPWTPEPAWQAEEPAPAEERFEPAPWLDDSPVVQRMEPQDEWDSAPRAARLERERLSARRLRIAEQDALSAPAPRHVSPLIQALRRPEGLRQAVVLREILGPPKGLPS